MLTVKYMDMYKIAGMIIGISSPDKSYVKLCRDYIYNENEPCKADLIINISDDDIENEKKLYSYDCSSAMANYSRIYRAICEHAITKGGFFLHSATIEYDGLAYGFLAPSGTGKTTHIKLWRKLLGDRVSIVNGDKPLIMPNENGVFYANGTPWSGKEGWQKNVSVKMRAICILKRGKENSIKEISAFEALNYIIKQTLIPDDEKLVEKLLENVDRFISGNIKFYVLHCNMDIDAAVTSFEKMTGESAKRFLDFYYNNQERN